MAGEGGSTHSTIKELQQSNCTAHSNRHNGKCHYANHHHNHVNQISQSRFFIIRWIYTHGGGHSSQGFSGGYRGRTVKTTSAVNGVNGTFITLQQSISNQSVNNQQSISYQLAVNDQSMIRHHVLESGAYEFTIKWLGVANPTRIPSKSVSKVTKVIEYCRGNGLHPPGKELIKASHQGTRRAARTPH